MTGPPARTAPLWTSAEAEAATEGHSTRPWTATGVSIDSRSLLPGDLFVAIKGPRTDAHDFLEDAFARGAAAAMVSRIPREYANGAPLLIVDDTYSGLKKLARAARGRTRAGVVGVTGSVGKTSTKEALAMALRASGRVAATEGNLNNMWGVPLSLARMPADSDYGVFEIGMNHAGEITPLARLARPRIAIITTIEAVHIEFFDSLEGIARAKAEIFDGMDHAGVAVLNADNPYFDVLAARAKARGIGRVVGFGAREDADARLVSFTPDGPSKVEAVVMGEALAFPLALPGRHSALNAMAVLAAVKLLGADLRAGAEALGAMDPPAGRGRRLAVRPASGGTAMLIDDSYNASPASMRAAFLVLAHSRPGPGGRRIAVLGDMLELGQGSARAHAALADDLLAANVDLVLTTGPNMMHLDDALPRAKRGGHTSRAGELAPLLSGLLRDGDVVLVKGSHSQRLGAVVSALAMPAGDARPAANGN